MPLRHPLLLHAPQIELKQHCSPHYVCLLPFSPVRPPSPPTPTPHPLHPTYPPSQQASLYQAMVLLLFNERDTWTFKELQQQTDIQPGELKRALQGMLQGKSELLVVV